MMKSCVKLQMMMMFHQQDAAYLTESIDCCYCFLLRLHITHSAGLNSAEIYLSITLILNEFA